MGEKRECGLGAVKCPCRRLKCPRHGDCEACREHHRLEKKMLPTCERIRHKTEKEAGK